LQSNKAKEKNQMRHKVFLALLFLVLMFGLASCAMATPSGGGEAGSAAAPAVGAATLTAVKVNAVSLDSAAGYWADAPALTVHTVSPIEGNPDGPDVNIQAVYDDNAIAMRFEWADASESIWKNAWAWDGSAFKKSGDEDRLQLLWPIENHPEFASKGCAAVCHNLDPDQGKWYMSTENESLRFDVFHWKSTRTNPVGQADDQWLSVLTDPNDTESSRHGDAKDSGGYADNVNEAKDGPAFVNGADPQSPFILTDDKAAIDVSQLAANAIIPGFVLSPFAGSRGDLAAAGKWENGKWVVVLMRPLDTGHDDDVVFTPPKRYAFGLSVTDDGGATDHTNAPDVLTLEWK
jgi:hypothetical protein